MIDPQASQQRMQQMLEQQLRGQQEGAQPHEVGESLSPSGQQDVLPQRPASVPLRPGAGLQSSSLLEELRPGSVPLHPSEAAGLQPHLPPLPEDHGRPGSVPLQLPPLASSRLVPLPGSSGVSSLRMPGSAQGGTRRNSVRWPEDVISQAASGSRPGSVGSLGYVTSAAFPTQVWPLPLIASEYIYAPSYLRQRASRPVDQELVLYARHSPPTTVPRPPPTCQEGAVQAGQLSPWGTAESMLEESAANGGSSGSMVSVPSADGGRDFDLEHSTDAASTITEVQALPSTAEVAAGAASLSGMDPDLAAEAPLGQQHSIASLELQLEDTAQLLRQDSELSTSSIPPHPQQQPDPPSPTLLPPGMSVKLTGTLDDPPLHRPLGALPPLQAISLQHQLSPRVGVQPLHSPSQLAPFVPSPALDFQTFVLQQQQQLLLANAASSTKPTSEVGLLRPNSRPASETGDEAVAAALRAALVRTPNTRLRASIMRAEAYASDTSQMVRRLGRTQ